MPPRGVVPLGVVARLRMLLPLVLGACLGAAALLLLVAAAGANGLRCRAEESEEWARAEPKVGASWSAVMVQYERETKQALKHLRKAMDNTGLKAEAILGRVPVN